MALTFKQDDTMFEIDAIEELANFILEIASRILAEDQSNKEFLQIILANTKAVIDIAHEDLQSRSMVLATSGWANKKDELIKSHIVHSKGREKVSKSASTSQAPLIFTPAVNGYFNTSYSNTDSNKKLGKCHRCVLDRNRADVNFIKAIPVTNVKECKTNEWQSGNCTRDVLLSKIRRQLQIPVVYWTFTEFLYLAKKLGLTSSSIHIFMVKVWMTQNMW